MRLTSQALKSTYVVPFYQEELIHVTIYISINMERSILARNRSRTEPNRTEIVQSQVPIEGVD